MLSETRNNTKQYLFLEQINTHTNIKKMLPYDPVNQFCGLTRGNAIVKAIFLYIIRFITETRRKISKGLCSVVFSASLC